MQDNYNLLDIPTRRGWEEDDVDTAQSFGKKKIVDVKSDKHFGMMLTTQLSIEAFQKQSGMLKPYTSEYQFHYWALVARIEIDDEVLDIAIPTAMFNYYQEVAGSSVDFHLNDVEAASALTREIAQAKAQEIIDSEFGKKLLEMLPIIEWHLHPLNTCHVHPQGVTSFSGTDYCKTITDAGICFPLDEPVKQASFSSILIHGTGNVAKMVRTEYRYANFENGNNTYYHGACMAYIKGYVAPVSPMKSLFFGMSDIETKSYLNKDRISTDIISDSLKQIIDLFNDFDYEPDVTFVLEKNIVKKHYAATGYVPAPAKMNWIQEIKKEKQAKNSSKSLLEDQEEDDELEEMRETLVLEGFKRSQVISWNYTQLKSFYDRVVEENKTLVREPQGFDETVFSFKEDQKAIQFLKQYGFSETETLNMDEAELEKLLTQLGY